MGTSKNGPFRLPEKGAGKLLQHFSRHGIDGAWYSKRYPKIDYGNKRYLN